MCLARVAQVFAVDPGALQLQFQDLRPFAEKMHSQAGPAPSGAPSAAAWAKALAKAGDRKKFHREAHPVAALECVLARYVAFCGKFWGSS